MHGLVVALIGLLGFITFWSLRSGNHPFLKRFDQERLTIICRIMMLISFLIATAGLSGILGSVSNTRQLSETAKAAYFGAFVGCIFLSLILVMIYINLKDTVERILAPYKRSDESEELRRFPRGFFRASVFVAWLGIFILGIYIWVEYFPHLL